MAEHPEKTLRDEFAIAALPFCADFLRKNGGSAEIARAAYVLADAMMRARKS